MRTHRFDVTEPVRRNRLNTQTIARFEEVESFDELLAALEDLRTEEPSARVVCTLDDVDQCAYTSMHAAEDERLYLEEDGDDDEAEGDADEDDVDDPIARRRFDEAVIAHRAGALDDVGLQVDWKSLPGDRVGGRSDVEALAAWHREPDRVLDRVVLVQRVSVARDDLVLAGIPNGYFSADWDTFQNHAIVRRMARHGYRHFGVGACVLGFDRPTVPTPEEADAVIQDLVRLYGAAEAPEWRELALSLTRRPLLLIAYAESVGEVLGEIG